MAEELFLSKQEVLFEVASVAQKIYEHLDISNRNEKRMYFKIMTAAKGRYVVKPSVGVIEPKSSLSVEIMVDASNLESNLAEIRDKFVVYSCASDENATERKEIEDLMNSRKDSCKSTRFTASFIWINSMQPLLFRCTSPIMDTIKSKAPPRNIQNSVAESDLFTTTSQSELAPPVLVSSDFITPSFEIFDKVASVYPSETYKPEAFPTISERIISTPSIPRQEEKVSASSTIKSRAQTSADILNAEIQPTTDKKNSDPISREFPQKITAR